MAKCVNITQLAEALDVSRMTIHRAVSAGRLAVNKRDEHNRPLFELEAARKQWREWQGRSEYQSHHTEGKKRGGRPRKNGQPSTPASPTNASAADSEINITNAMDGMENLSEAQRLARADFLKKIWDAKYAKLKTQEKEGTLIAKEKVRDQGVELGAILLGALLILPDRLSEQLATMSDAHEINELLFAEVNAMAANIRKHCGIQENEPVAAVAEAAPVENDPA